MFKRPKKHEKNTSQISYKQNSFCDTSDLLMFFFSVWITCSLGIIHHIYFMKACLNTFNWPIEVDLKKNKSF